MWLLPNLVPVRIQQIELGNKREIHLVVEKLPNPFLQLLLIQIRLSYYKTYNIGTSLKLFEPTITISTVCELEKGFRCKSVTKERGDNQESSPLYRAWLNK